MMKTQSLVLICLACVIPCSAQEITKYYSLPQAKVILEQYFQKQITKARLPIEQDTKEYNAKLKQTNKILIEQLDKTQLSIDDSKLRIIKKDLKKALMLEFDKEYQNYKMRKDVFLSGLAYKQELKRWINYVKEEVKLFINVSLDVRDKTKAKFLWQAAKYNIVLQLLNDAITPDEVSKMLIIDKSDIIEIIQACKEYLNNNKDHLLQIQARTKFFKTPIKPRVYYGGGAGPSFRRTPEYYKEKAATKIQKSKHRAVEIGQLVDWKETSTPEQPYGIESIIPES